MSTKHTPGPWNNGSDANGNMIIFQRRDDPYLPPESVNEEWQANLRLCDAAPELLQLVIDLQESASYWSEYDVPIGIVDRINTAIAKATGEI